MSLRKIYVLCGTLGAGALGSAIGLPIWLTARGGGNRQVASEARVDSIGAGESRGETAGVAKQLTAREKWLQSYKKRTCYKWIYQFDVGEVFPCLDESGERTSGENSIFFVLWWLQGKQQGTKDTFTEIDQIKVESSDSNSKTISFVYPKENTQRPERKLTIKDPWAKNLENLSNKNLKSICKIDGSNLSCGDSSDYEFPKKTFQNTIFSVAYSALQNRDMWFYLSDR